MTDQQIALREKINEAKAKERKYSCWEFYLAERVRRVINYQSALRRRIELLEYDFHMLPKVTDREKSDAAWSLKKVLGGLL